MFTIREMDHIVINVKDMDTVLDFYTQILGLEAERLAEFRQGKVPFPSVRVNHDTVIDFFPASAEAAAGEKMALASLNHFCLVVDKADMPQVIQHLQQHGVTIEQGPVPRWGAHGTGMSIYFYDPEQRQIEIRYYDN